MDSNRTAKRSTISDVAKHAGVSTMTVSRVVNHDNKVREKTRKLVENSIAALHYFPNVAAQNLAGGRPLRICILYGNPSSAYLGELLLGALEAASSPVANLIVERMDTENLTFDDLKLRFHRDWDAMIVPPPMCDIAGIRKLVTAENFPTVFISSARELGHANEVRIDDRLAARHVTKYLIGKGHENIAFIKGHPNQSVSQARYDGYQDALDDANIILTDEYVEQGYFTYKSGRDAADILLSLPNPPTAIFASNDDMAAGVLASATRYGFQIPQDLAVVGFDDSPTASIVWPQLTTLRQPVAEMAAKAVEILTMERRNDDFEMQSVVADYDFIERGST